MRLGKDRTPMLQSFLILLLKVSDKDWIQGFQIRIITVHCVCSFLPVDFEFNPKALDHVKYVNNSLELLQK